MLHSKHNATCAIFNKKKLSFESHFTLILNIVVVFFSVSMLCSFGIFVFIFYVLL